MNPPPRRFRPHRLTWAGLTIAIVGSGPLVVVILAAKIGMLADTDPNPVGLGILAMCTFWPGTVLAGVGVASSVTDVRRNRRG